MTGWQPPGLFRRQQFYIADVHRKEVARMTVYEAFGLILDVISLLISLSMLVIALLTFLQERKKHKK